MVESNFQPLLGASWDVEAELAAKSPLAVDNTAEMYEAYFTLLQSIVTLV